MPSYYLECLADLSDNYQVVFFDQLGCGRSERPEDLSLWTVPRAVAEVEAVRNALDLGRVALLGHSWGGFLALSYAAAHADHVSEVVLSSPLVSVDRWMGDAAELVSRLPSEVRRTIQTHEEQGDFDAPEYAAATMAFYRQFFCKLDPWPPELDQTFKEMGDQAYEAMWGPSEFTQTGNLRGQDLSPLLDDMPMRSLWICGSDDEVLPATLKGFASRARGLARVFDGGTHCVHLEQTRAYLSAVHDFLAK